MYRPFAGLQGHDGPAHPIPHGGRFEARIRPVSDGQESAGRKGRLRALLAWGGTLALLAYLGLTTDFATAWTAFQNADHVLFLATVVISTFATYLTDVATVRVLLRHVGIRVGFKEFLRVKGASYLLNIVNYNLALVMMAAVVRKRTDRGWGAAGSPFVLLNFLDLSVFGTFVLAALLSGQSPFEGPVTILVGFFAAGAIAAPTILCMIARLDNLPGLLGKVFAHDLLAAFRHLSFRAIPGMMALRSILILEYAVMNWAFLRSFGTEIPILQLLVFMPIISLIAIIPVSVAGLGSTQVVMREFYGPYVPSTLAATTAARMSVIDAFSTAAIVGPVLLRVVIGLACLPWVSRTLAEARTDQEAP